MRFDQRRAQRDGWGKLLNWFLPHCEIQHYPAHRTLIQPSISPDSLFFVIEGTVMAFLRDETEREVILHYLHEREFVGELALFSDRETHMVWAKTKTACQIAKIGRRKMRELCALYPEILEKLTAQLTRQCLMAFNKISQLAFMTVPQRIAQALELLAGEPEALTHPLGKQIRVTRQEIGQLIGCSRETVGRNLKLLETQGLLSAKGKTIIFHVPY